MVKRAIALLLAMFLAFSAEAADDSGHVELTRTRVLQQTGIPVYGYRIVQTYPHDRTSYTEGLQMVDGIIYEGTGLYGRSRLRKWNPQTGHVLNEVQLDTHVFGEGITVLDNLIFQLTYLENTGYVYDGDTWQRRQDFRYVTQGWGLTNNGRHLLMSNGSSAILFLDPRSGEIVQHVFVTDDVGPVGFLDELEFADGKLYANIWQTDFIAIIQPETGKIIGWIDLSGLNPDPAVLVYPYVLNGIAYNRDTGRLLVTGKCWPHVYEVDLIPR